MSIRNAMILRIIRQVSVLLSSFFLCSCLQDIEPDSGSELPIVVDCVLQMDTIQTLRLYHMRKMYEEVNEPLADATVELLQQQYDGGEYVKVAKFHLTEGIIWEARYKPEYGAKYKLSVSRPGEDEISATTTFPYDFRLVLQKKIVRRSNKESDSVAFQAITADLAIGAMVSKKDFDIGGRFSNIYYHWLDYLPERPFKVYLRDNQKSCKIWIYPHADSTLVFPYANYYLYPFEVSELSFVQSSHPYCRTVVTDHPNADNFNLVPGKVADLDIVNVPVNSMERIIYNPDIQMYSSEVVNYTQWCSFLCPELPLHKDFVRIDYPSGFQNGLKEEDLKNSYQYSTSSFMILSDYSNYLSGVEPFLIEVRFLSDEYDAFLRDLHVKEMSQEDFVLSTYDKSNIYSNINGGVGIFGAEIVTWAERAFFSSTPYNPVIL